MKKLIVLVASIVALSAADYTVLFKVRCPECLDEQVLAAKQVLTTGGSSLTNAQGVAGNLQTRTGQFHCPDCHTDFSAMIKPDLFVPLTEMIATPIAIVSTSNVVEKVRPIHPSFPMGEGLPPFPISTNKIDEVVRTIDLPDGSQYIVIRRYNK